MPKKKEKMSDDEYKIVDDEYSISDSLSSFTARIDAKKKALVDAITIKVKEFYGMDTLITFTKSTIGNPVNVTETSINTKLNRIEIVFPEKVLLLPDRFIVNSIVMPMFKHFTKTLGSNKRHRSTYKENNQHRYNVLFQMKMMINLKIMDDMSDDELIELEKTLTDIIAKHKRV